MDEELVERVNERVKRLGATRSEFVRRALQAALHRYEESEREERHIAGYRRMPPTPHEFAIPEEDHAWGDEFCRKGAPRKEALDLR